jgi:hypothetical protein
MKGKNSMYNKLLADSISQLDAGKRNQPFLKETRKQKQIKELKKAF